MRPPEHFLFSARADRRGHRLGVETVRPLTSGLLPPWAQSKESTVPWCLSRSSTWLPVSGRQIGWLAPRHILPLPRERR